MLLYCCPMGPLGSQLGNMGNMKKNISEHMIYIYIWSVSSLETHEQIIYLAHSFKYDLNYFAYVKWKDDVNIPYPSSIVLI
jgi:hypothetical protein